MHLSKEVLMKDCLLLGLNPYPVKLPFRMALCLRKAETKRVLKLSTSTLISLTLFLGMKLVMLGFNLVRIIQTLQHYDITLKANRVRY
jgi:hypothetical protein